MIGVGLMFFTAGGASKPNKIQFTAPDPIKEHLEAIMKIREDIRDSNVGSLVEQGCLDTNRYFARNRNSKYIDSDVELFSGHLRLLLEVLQAYVDVQNSQRYNVEYQSLMECGREAAQGYADFALSCNQREANLRAETFKVNTAILSAQRFNPDLP